MDVNKIAAQLQEPFINQNGFLEKMVQMCLQKVIDVEFSRFIGANEYERSEERKGYRNGSYERQLNTRVGSITLHVCRDRAGEFQTELFEKYQRNEKPLYSR